MRTQPMKNVEENYFNPERVIGLTSCPFSDGFQGTEVWLEGGQSFTLANVTPQEFDKFLEDLFGLETVEEINAVEVRKIGR